MTTQQRYLQLQHCIQDVAQQVGRDNASICVIAVTKAATGSQMQEAYKAGVRHFGESRLQSALPKLSQFPKDLSWHYIGPLQSNKIAKIVRFFDYIHSVASLQMAQQISLAAGKEGRIPFVFLQVNISQEFTKQGFSEEELLKSFSMLRDLPHLHILGLMTIAPLTQDRERVRFCFRRLAALARHLGLPHTSMGMSQDYSLAIEEGATFLRMGSLLFGEN